MKSNWMLFKLVNMFYLTLKGILGFMLSLFKLLMQPICRSSYTCPCAVWAGFSERIRDGNKFVVAEKPLKQVSRKYCTETDDSIIEERKSRRENASNGFFDEGKNGASSANLLDSVFTEE